MAKKILSRKNGYWCKMIRGKVYYFGKNYGKAVAAYKKQEPFLREGVQAPSGDDETVLDLLDAFLSDRMDKLNAGDISIRTYNDYDAMTDEIAKAIPLKLPLKTLLPKHFKRLRKRLVKGKNKDEVSAKTLNRLLGYARTIFRFASIDNQLIDRNLPYTTALASVPRREIRKHKASQPERRLTREEIKAVINHAPTCFKAIIYLGINGGWNNSDIAQLELSHLQAITDDGILSYHRRKTYFQRVTPLWPETRAALAAAVECRPKSSLPFVFISSRGRGYYEPDKQDLISKSFFRYLKKLELWAPGKNFGALRTTFANVGAQIRDDLAVKACMGHEDGSTLYREYADTAYIPRLKKVTDHVHDWLFAKK